MRKHQNLEMDTTTLDAPSSFSATANVLNSTQQLLKPARPALRNSAAAAVNTLGGDMDAHAPLRFALVLMVVAMGIALHVYCRLYNNSSEEKQPRSDILYHALMMEEDSDVCVDMDSLDSDSAAVLHNTQTHQPSSNSITQQSRKPSPECD